MIRRLFTRKGTHHIDNCEDAAGIYQVGEDRVLMLVADGCSMGDQSHFAAELFNKTLREIAKEEYYREYGSKQSLPMSELLARVMKELFARLKSVKAALRLGEHDLLATLLLAVVDALTHEVIYLVVGDGLVITDHTVTDFDQDNKPDYLGYHLDEPFDAWYLKQTSGKITVTDYFALSTDGVYTFADELDQRVDESRIQYILREIIMSADTGVEGDLKNKVDMLEAVQRLRPTDDVAFAKIVLPRGQN